MNGATVVVDGVDVIALTDIERTQRLEDLATLVAKAEHAMACLVAEMAVDGTFDRAGCRSETTYLTDRVHLSPARARSIRIAAAATTPRTNLGGQTVPPKLPSVAAAAALGVVGTDHVVAVSKAIDALPDELPQQKFDEAELVLGELAKTGTPKDIGAAGRAILDLVDPDHKFRNDGPTADGRGLTIGKPGADGLSPIRGYLTPVLRELLVPSLEALSRKGLHNPDDASSPSGEDSIAEAARRDKRSTAQRMHDALAVMAASGNGTGHGSTHRGVQAVPIICMNLSDLERRAGAATTFNGGELSIADAVRLAAMSTPELAVFADFEEVPLTWGRQRRLATREQRLALFASQQGCTFVGCDKPASACEIHHAVNDWVDGGTTDIGSLALACPAHHRFTQLDPKLRWHTAIVGEHHRDRGNVAWIPPAAYDPRRTPRVSRTHHPADVLAEATARAKNAWTELTWDDLTPESRRKLHGRVAA